MMLDGASEESYSYDDTIVRCFLTVTLLWGFVAAVNAVLVTSTLLHPRQDAGVEWLSFGRLQPVGLLLFFMAFVGNGVFAGIYYSTQRLCKARMWSGALSWLHFFSWQAIIIAALVTLPRGISQGRELSEAEWPIDLAMTLVWILFFASNFAMTVSHRRVRRMYVSLWFYIAAVVGMGLNNLCTLFVFPTGLWKSDSLATGMQDALLQAWYSHNATLFLLIMPALGLAYYFVPKVLNRPIHSYKLTIVSFWTLTLVGVWAAPRLLHYTVLSEWVSSLGMLFGILFGVAVFGGVTNLLLTFRSSEVDKSANPSMRFLKWGVLLLGVYACEEIALSVKSIRAQVDYSEWITAHFQLGLMGCGGMLVIGMAYWMIPKLFETGIASSKAASLHFWLAAAGVLLCVLPGYAAGFVQSGVWNAMDDLGILKYDFAESTSFLKMVWSLQMLGGLVYFVGLGVMLANYTKTWMNRAKPYQVTVYHVESNAKQNRPVSTPEPVSILEAAPVLNVAKKVDIWTRLNWHQQWEESPRKIGVLVALVVLVAFTIELVPLFVFASSNVPEIASVQPYTPLELMGRHIYLTEGCSKCHTQMVRPLMAETKRYGEFSQAGEFVYDQPAQWGNRRIGPDLARESGKQASFWHWQHLVSPRKTSPDSAMPSYRYLLDRPIDMEEVDELVQAAQERGIGYDADLAEVKNSVSKQAESLAADIVSKGGTVRRGNLMTFDSQAVALIAYLQRLGADLSAPPAAKTKPAVAEDENTTSTTKTSTTKIGQTKTNPIDPKLTKTARDSDMNKMLTAVP
ncbi:MAG: cytochrome C oxidase Cbb3 [Rhodopirellula sp.]|nr:cytochrome C oxidase Cbb3 [Rhodopirellula sp.]